MISSLVCPHCGAAVDATGYEVGQTVTCRDCGKEVSVPDARRCDSTGTQFSMTRVLLVLAPIAGILFFLMLPSVNSRVSPRKVKCNNNLKQLAVAMHNYWIGNGCFPPAFVADKNGKPMHSWRALLLPYLEGVPQDLVAKYNFDEPWDSPNNRIVSDVALAIYHCPSEPNAEEPTTSYMMVVGSHTISDGPHSRKGSDFTDGTSNTIMLVEVADSGIGWAEPKDLEFDKIDFKINGKKRPGIGSPHSGGTNIAMCDGSVRWVSDTMEPVMLKAMLTIDGGEKTQEEKSY
jgi:prepilin-type processing-associated H-X9-DG protein